MGKFFAFLAVGALLAVGGCQSGHEGHDHSAANTKSSSNKPVMASTDACAKCPGVQMMTTDGRCASCGAPVVDACSQCPGVQMMSADGKCSSCGMTVKK